MTSSRSRRWALAFLEGIAAGALGIILVLLLVDAAILSLLGVEVWP